MKHTDIGNYIIAVEVTDNVSDPGTETMYVKDENTGSLVADVRDATRFPYERLFKLLQNLNHHHDPDKGAHYSVKV